MPSDWRSSADVLAQRLRDHHGVADVEAAWRAFADFAQVEFAGVDPEDDGVIVQWGCYSWNDFRPALTFTRQLADADDGALWQVSLEMCFPEEPDLTSGGTEFDFAPIGPQRRAALAALANHPRVRAWWRTVPLTRRLTLDRAD